jgi:uncharacterized repeat protein (TIGR03803 family)
MRRTFSAITMVVLVMFAAVALLEPKVLGGRARAASGGKVSVTVLYNFGGKSGDPLYPQYQGLIAQGRDGSLYSTTPYGGTSNYGTVFKITPAGKLTVLYSFAGSDVSVDSGLTLGTDGNFYGTTIYGGNDYGTVFKITPDGELTTLYEFTGQNQDAYPHAPPIQAADGNLYGTAAGDFYGNGGEVYKMSSSGGKVTLFEFDHSQGAAAADPLVQGTDGSFYATTNGGGNNDNCGSTGCGVVFKITASGHVTVLHDFDYKFNDGIYPVAALIEASDGSFYGTVPQGGAGYGYGTAFKITSSGKFTLLHVFNGDSDGRFPTSALVQATDGNFYGTTWQGGSAKGGVIYRVTPEGKFSVLYNFDGTTNLYPLVTLVEHTNGKFYGETYGYPYNYGTFFSLDLGLGPFVSLVSTSGKVGKSIGILGQGFTGATGVSFNGESAKFSVISDTFLTATVPDGATTGFVTVATRGGRLKSNKKFQVTR